jgi:hypothetical protein
MLKALSSALALGLLLACGSGRHASTPPAQAPANPATGSWSGAYGLPGLNGFGSRANVLVKDAHGQLFVGGIFDDAAGVPAANVARWDGTSWHALGAGLPGQVNALLFAPDGSLWAGGSFATVADPNNHLAHWNGTTWTMDAAALDGDVLALAQQGSRMLVGGWFSHAGAQSMGGLAAFDGAAWTNVGDTDGAVEAIVVTGPQSFMVGGEFGIAGGVATNCAAVFDGAAWDQLGGGLPGEVKRMVMGPDGRAYAAGNFTFITDPNTGAYVAGLGVLDNGAWQPLYGGIDNGFINEVRALTFAANGDLLVGGTFSTAGASQVFALNIARYSAADQAWSPVGSGVMSQVGISIGSVQGVTDILENADGSLVIGGLFSNSGDGAFEGNNIAQWGGGAWSALKNPAASYQGLSGLINALGKDGSGRLVAAGYFSGAGGLPVSNVARLGTKGWEALGAGLDGPVYSLLVRANGDLLAGGPFGGSGATYAPNFARFDGTAWGPVGDLLDGPVNAIIEDGKGGVYVGGYFVNAGSLPVNGVAHWDGAAWSAVGEGFDGAVTSLALDASGHLVATGIFTNSGATAVNGLASWNGTAWQSIGGGFDQPWNYGMHLGVYGQDLLIAGSFPSIGGQPIAGLARWDGSHFTAVGAGLTGAFGDPFVTQVLPSGNGFFVTGAFQTSGSTQVSNVAWWDGTAFRPLGSGLDDLGAALCLKGNALFVGGGFLQAGGKTSVGLAQWDFNAGAGVAGQPGATQGLVQPRRPMETRSGRSPRRQDAQPTRTQPRKGFDPSRLRNLERAAGPR